MTLDADVLLSGPRGRGVLLHLLDDGDVRGLLNRADSSASPGTHRLKMAYSAPSPRGPRGWVDRARLKREFAAHQREARRSVAPAELAAAIAKAPFPIVTDAAIAEALSRSVDDAKPYQPADHSETVAADERVIEALRRLAQAVAESTFAAAWGVAAAAQWAVVKAGREVAPEDVAEPAAVLDAWHAAMVEAEREAREVSRGTSRWWSRPPHGLPTATAAWKGFGPAALYLEEDSFGSREATATPVSAPPERTFEVTGAEAWAQLCREYPLDVTYSQRDIWRVAIGFDGGWIVPDWRAMAADWDAVHLTVSGYLEAATRPIVIADGQASAIAGWNADETVWLTARPSEMGPAVAWKHRDQFGWRSDSLDEETR